MLMAASQTGGGGNDLTFPIVLTTDYCEEMSSMGEICYKDLADGGVFYDAMFQFLKDNTMYPEYDDYYEYESSEPILMIDNIGFSNITWFEGEDVISSETFVAEKMRVLFIHNNGMVEVEKWD